MIIYMEQTLQLLPEEEIQQLLLIGEGCITESGIRYLKIIDTELNGNN